MRFILLISAATLLFTGCAKEPVAMNLYTPGKGTEKIISADTVITKDMILSVKRRMPARRVAK